MEKSTAAAQRPLRSLGWFLGRVAAWSIDAMSGGGFSRQGFSVGKQVLPSRIDKALPEQTKQL